MGMIESAEEFEKRLGIRHGFFNELICENDWSFVIKLHAFFEASLTHAICASLGRPELEDVISRLDTSNKNFGKIAFVKQLRLLEKPQRRYITALSELRNKLVHNINSADFDFRSYIDNLPDNERYNFCVSLSLNELLEPLSEPGELKVITLVHDIPKFGIVQAGLLVLTDLHLQIVAGDLRQQYTTIGEKLVARSLEAITL
jgi:hypothetical protein